MRFCTKCGNEITEGKLFCTNCGNDLRKEADTQTESVDDAHVDVDVDVEPFKINTEDSSISNFILTKKSKMLIALCAILIIAIVAAIKIGDSLSDPNRLVSRFENDITSNNVSDLSKILYSSDTRLIIDSKSISPLLSYFKSSNPSYYNEVIEDLKKDAMSPKDTNSLSIKSGNLLTLINTGKSFFIFPSYKINIKPAFINITTTVKDVTFSINNTQIGKSDTDASTKEFGPYIPGNYSLLAGYKGKYITLSKPYPVDLVTAANGVATLSVFDDINYINISSDNPDAEVFVNGKDANVKVKDATSFGPIDSSAKIYATYAKDGKALKSEVSTVPSDTKELNLSFEASASDLENVQNQIKDLLGYYSSNFTEAINTNNVSLIDPYVATGTELYKQQESYIPSTFKAGIEEYVISADITNYNISDDNKSGNITTSEVYNISKDGTSSNDHFSYVYNFQYNDSTSSYQFTSIKKAK